MPQAVENLEAIQEFIAGDSPRYADLVEERLVTAAAKGRPIGDRDLMIAAIARSNRLIVVTSNVGEFARVPELKVEDWMV
jgi:tRNA(fMet)-specific endonuclease VapC